MHSKNNIESLPFLGDFDEAELRQNKNASTKITTWTKLYLLFLHVLIVSLIWCLYRRGTASVFRLPTTDGATWSPAQDVLEYEINNEHTTNHDFYSKYSGPPSDEQDVAWDALMRPVYFNASLDEVLRAEETITDDMAEVAEGGYLANMAVYHELHCVRQLRFWLYKDRYYPSLTDAQNAYQVPHLDHCLETLRQAVQCHANTALYTFYWDEPTDMKPLTKSNSRSVCAKWGPLEEWAYSRMVSTSPEYNRKQSEG
ncbi:hypothetical protein F4821DRAFT_259769 [Hypoxylon rubiginosum]|uniref:Uncharacterized protein n=1 Tax=Hypoxylon rubiginosum TaxID=110542 RepID=A0ACC0D2H6_9PEZI|nr:hypothetical protein F4821DRAFT_259769 [Hypoxylon rubiginosum]